MNVTLWSDVSVDMQSAAATAITISAITKADPGVATYSGADPSNGDVIRVTATGMAEVDGRVFRVANVDTVNDTLELEGEDTTLFSTFTSGSFEVITLGTSVSTISDLSASGGDFNFVPTTTIHQNVETQIPSTASAISFSFTNIWDVSDAGLIAMKAASDTKTAQVFKFTFANGQIMLFNGYVGATLLPTGSAQDKVTTPVTVTMFGTPTYYAS